MPVLVDIGNAQDKAPDLPPRLALSLGELIFEKAEWNLELDGEYKGRRMELKVSDDEDDN